MLERREFLQAAGAAAALFGLPSRSFGAADALPPELIERALCPEPPPLPSEELFARSPETYWAELRRQWLFRPGFLYLNNGTVGSSPLPVVRAFIESVLKKSGWRTTTPSSTRSGATAPGTSTGGRWRSSSAPA